MFCYKYLAGTVFLLLFISCKHRPKDTLKFVNDQNDGFNAFSITLRNDNTYKREDFGSSHEGKYSISGNNIFFGEEKIVFDTTRLGCIYNARYISKNNSTDMRVVFDSLFCNHISGEKLIGNWEYETSLLKLDTLQLNKNGTAKFRGDSYKKWDFSNSQLFLTEYPITLPILVLNIQEDSLWFSTYLLKDSLHVIKAIRAE